MKKLRSIRLILPTSVTSLVFLLLVVSCKTPQYDAAGPYAPATALATLVAGNRRFVQGKSKHPHQSHRRIVETENGQHPFAVVITCSDSRVSPEIIFDGGLGDLFVVRTAGNLLSDLELGSIEYAVEHLGAALVVVLGHTECGAVKAFVEGGETSGHITDIVKALVDEQEEQLILRYEGKNLQACIEGNILHGVVQIERDEPVLSEKIAHGKLAVVPMLYDIHTGLATVLQEHELRKKHHAEK